MNPVEIPKTVFLTKYGPLELTHMPFGICNVPATFQHVVQLVFRGMTWKEHFTYLDYLNVVRKRFHDHLGNVTKSFE